MGLGHPISRAAALLAISATLTLACSGTTSPSPGAVASASVHPVARPAVGIHKIAHVIVVMQENRSFDSYFGTFPGADGIPMVNGAPTVCIPDPRGPCRRPFHDTDEINAGGPHSRDASAADVDGGRMDGFIAQGETITLHCTPRHDPRCGDGGPAIVGYHDAHEIPNYWTYAHDFVLQDHMFEPVASWSLPAHLFLVSGWSAHCAKVRDPMSCSSAPMWPDLPMDMQGRKTLEPNPGKPDYAWTDLTWLLHANGISWGYYVTKGTEPDCRDDTAACKSHDQVYRTPGIWNPLPSFDDVRGDGQVANVQDTSKFFRQAGTGTLPAVSWVEPSGDVSEHPPASISVGQAFVTKVVNAVMQGPDWSSSAIFVAWDDWGGFYDHMVPPIVDNVGYGLRVPGLLISPYARTGYIDHQTLSFDAYMKFIEDDFLGGARLDPSTDGRPDSRPGVRERAAILGDLTQEFDFNQPPRPPVVLPSHPS